MHWRRFFGIVFALVSSRVREFCRLLPLNLNIIGRRLDFILLKREYEPEKLVGIYSQIRFTSIMFSFESLLLLSLMG